MNESTAQAVLEPTTETRSSGQPHALARYRSRALRVMHGCENPAQGMKLTRALRQWGCEAHCLSYRPDVDGHGEDIFIDRDGAAGAWGKRMTMMRAFMKWGPKFDVFHFHVGASMLPRLSDVPLLKAMGKKVVFHFHGCDVRNRAHMLRTQTHSACSECDPFCQPRRQRWLLEWAARHGDAMFYSTMDLAEFVPGGRFLPLAIEPERWSAAFKYHQPSDATERDGISGPVVIGHAPTHRLIKGTHHVERAVASLRGRFPKLQLRMMENVAWEQVPSFLAQCDIVVDHLGMGWYGTVAVEAMATARPVVLHVRDDLAKLMPDLPAVNADRNTLAPVLEELIRDPERRADLGAKGRAFVRRHHDARVVGRQLLEIYRRLLGD